jgi:hypothetical protein
MHNAVENFHNLFPQQNAFSPPPHSHDFDACFFVTLVSLKRNKRLCVLPTLLIMSVETISRSSTGF